MKENEQLQHLYQLYLNNQCTTAELTRFFELLDKSKDDQQMMALLSGTWDQIGITPETGLIPDFLKTHTKEVKPEPVRTLNFRLKSIISAAAVLLIIAGIYLYRSEFAFIFKPVQHTEVLVTNDTRKQIQLADGTKVWLSPNSTLGYPDKFEGTERHVTLNGEAFFEVTHDASHPFVIKSGDVSTTVLGTSFNVMAYTQQHTINVTLVTGKVAVALKANNNTQCDTIVANQQIIIDKAALKITKVNYPDAAAFLNKRLGLYEYRGAALQEVGNDLENQYNIQVELGPEFDTGTFYGHLNMTEPIAETLNKLCTVMEAKWKKDGGQYVITK